MSDTVQEMSSEEQELLELWRSYERYPKLSQWLRLYFDKKNELGQNTYLDGTKSAIIAYSIPEEKQHYAYEIASKNTTKCNIWVQRYLAEKGWTKEKTIDLILSHSIDGKPVAIKMLASLHGVYQERPNTLIQNNTQINNGQPTDKELSQTEETELNNEFKAFVQFRAKTQSNPETTQQSEG